MSTAEQSIEVDVPVRVAYDQWTQFESFPEFMDEVAEVRQIDDTHLHWRARAGGHEAEWDALVTEQVPDRRIAWRATDGKENGGLVTFEPVEEARTRVTVRIDYEPEGMMERVGAAFGADSREVKSALRSFKELIERRNAPSGGWRGTVEGGQPRP
jgi:uncharacterized membrane protein